MILQDLPPYGCFFFASSTNVRVAKLTLYVCQKKSQQAGVWLGFETASFEMKGNMES